MRTIAFPYTNHCVRIYERFSVDLNLHAGLRLRSRNVKKLSPASGSTIALSHWASTYAQRVIFDGHIACRVEMVLKTNRLRDCVWLGLLRKRPKKSHLGPQNSNSRSLFLTFQIIGLSA